MLVLKKWEQNGENDILKDLVIVPLRKKFLFLKWNMTLLIMNWICLSQKNQVGFIARNIVDTRYATKAFLQYLNAIKSKNGLSYKVKTINGKMTSFARRQIEKNSSAILKRPDEYFDGQFDPETKKKIRDWNGHHAEDAYLITILNKHYRDAKIIEKTSFNPRKIKVFEKSNIESKKEDAMTETLYSNLMGDLDKALYELNNKMDKMRFSRRVNKRKNIQLFNESVYSTKVLDDRVHLVKKIKILEMTSDKLSSYFDEDNPKFHKNGKQLANIWRLSKS